ncbi:MAG: diguanylate cyclase [Lysobacteraceae bacterium]|nr:GGDEF domain-containing protein [Xanthomonadaceae bacterium]MCZ8319601.1 GGDEF domain-containing protein [Silanimonas sp.]
MDHALETDTRQIAFEQFARNFARALLMTPGGWLVVMAMAWPYAPATSLWAWWAGALACWLPCLAQSVWSRRRGFDVDRHRHAAGAAAFLDGIGWGMVPLFLMGHDPTLDARLAAVLCGVIAVTLGIYITAPGALRLQVAGTWACLGLAVALGRGPDWSIVFGLAVMHVLTLAFLPGITARVVDGIRLQQANARLAEQLRVHLQAVEEEAATDPLTGVLNRRALDRLLAREIERCEVQGTMASLLALDLDHFKAINDAHGHAVGDDALRAFTQRIRGQLRQSDHLARLGGEEFIVLLPGASLEKASEVAERLRDCVADAPLLDAPRVAVTVSIGVAAFRPGDSGTELLARADAAAYEAKRSGRDRVVLAEG